MNEEPRRSRKNFIRNLIPQFVLDQYRKLKRQSERRTNAQKSTEEVFSEIYASNQWGGQEGEFYSGGGTGDSTISTAYIQDITKLAEKLNFASLRAIDLGCGDMRIGQRIFPLFRSYTGIDIVKPLIEAHRKNFASDNITFQHLNIIEDELPDGEVCFIRQVLQHLSNEQILKILSKVRKYQYVIITEHLPSPNSGLVKNRDKPHGGDIRLYDNSGIYLTEPPFNLPQSEIATILEVSGHEFENYLESWMRGIIKTILYKP